ncbi:MAG: 16S rRNA (uracil(1498)-N(3))-methyltransferase [Deltaproteobacteria bacterium]|nr:16S rRNA (uracil(1498)-N(3))-methyltransferase [Deltaproteobacteria bacterium]
MRIPRLFYKGNITPPAEGELIQLDPPEAKHGVIVLRLHKGDSVTVLSPFGVASGQVELATGFGHPKMILKLLSPFQRPENSGPLLAIALVRPSAFEFALEKSVELGASQFIPILTSQTRVREFKDTKMSRWEKICITSQKQCGRVAPLELWEPIKLETFCANIDSLVPPDRPRLFLDPQGSPFPKETQRDPLLIVGPEAGFTATETKMIKEANFSAVTLGPLVLKTETAALAALAILFASLGN